VADLYEQAQSFREQLLSGDRRTAAVMIRSYGTAYASIDREIDRIRMRIFDLRQQGVEKERFAPLLYQEKRVQALRDKTLAEIGKFAQRSDIVVGGAVGEAVIAGSQDAQRLMQTTIPEGIAVAPATIEGQPVTAFSPDEVGLRTGALEQLTGVIQPGQPVASLFQSLGPEAANTVTDALISGLALGKNPQEIARMMRDALGGNLTRALTIARTETLRAYREASRAEYLANQDVVDGWIWVSAASERTCASCWAQHGSEHPLDEVMATHPRCRCSMVPKTKTWEQLGFGRTPESVKIPQGSSLFAKLPVEQQQKILGPSKFTAYRGKKIALSDLVARRQSPVWGPSTSEASLRQALANAEARKASRPVRQPRPKPVQVEEATGGSYLDEIKRTVGSRNQWGLSQSQIDALEPAKVRQETGKQPGPQLRAELSIRDTQIRDDLIENQVPQIERVGEIIDQELERRLATAPIPSDQDIAALRQAVEEARDRTMQRVGPDITMADKERWRQEWLEARRALSEARNAPALARRRILTEIIAEIRGEQPTKIKIKSTSQMASLVRDASGLLPRSWIDRMQEVARGMRVRKTQRGYFSEGERTIAVSKRRSVGEKDGFTVALHELGHWAEWRVPGLKELQAAWYRKRTIGEEPRKLRELTGNRSYGADEVAREDKFADPYTGRFYWDYQLPSKSNYEILTMTLEALFATDVDWAETLRKDPGTARFVLGMLALL
jgi:SPP1 gp7 family putative phage head morphogenesis protein